MRRALDFLGLTRPRDTQRRTVAQVIVNVAGGSLFAFGGVLIATGTMVGIALMVVGLACWVVEGVLVFRQRPAAGPPVPPGDD